MVQTRSQKKANNETNLYLTNHELNEITKNMLKVNREVNHVKSMLEYQNIELMKMKSFLSLLLLFLSIMRVFIYFFPYEHSINITYSDISYLFNSTLSEEWINQFVEKAQNINFFITIRE
jgi:hypothetical protein